MRRWSDEYDTAVSGGRIRAGRPVIDDDRDVYGVEPIAKVIPIAPPTYYACKAQERDPTLRSARAQRDEELRDEIGPGTCGPRASSSMASGRSGVS